MGKHVIQVDSLADWDKAANELRAYANSLRPKINEIIDRTATVGAMRASLEKSLSENTNVAVSIARIPHGKAVKESGPDVYFNEFGAGVNTNSASPYAAKVPVNVAPGSWSSTKGTHEFQRYGSWHHAGQTFKGVAPTRAMQKASENMKQEMPRIVGDVFK